MSLLKVNEIQIFNGTTVTITATTTETSADLNVGADLDVTGALTLGTALAIAEGGTGATDAATARTNLDVDQAGTDNSTDVTLVTTSHDYLSITGQAITLGPIDLATDVTGNLPYASISGTPTLGTAAAEDVGYFATAAQGTLADSAVQPGDDANTLGSGAATDGYVLTADGAGGSAWEAASGVSLPIDLLSSGASIRKSDGTTAVLSESGGAVTLENASLGDTVLMPDNSNNVSTAPGIRFEADTDTGIGLASAGNLAIVTSGTERMRIFNNGGLSIFSATTSNDTIDACNNQGAGTTYSTFIGRHSATGTTSGTVSIRIYTNGNVQNTNNSYGPLSSDERLKQDITDANSQWDDIKNIRITNFHYRSNPAGPLQLGPIAQELEQVSPGLITRRPASEDEIADPGNELVDGDEVLSFKASVLYMKAVKALQEAMERIETLEAKIDALETRIQALEV